MSKILLAAVGLAVAAVTAQPALAAPARKAVVRDWSKTVVTTTAGGFRMGNPAAKVTLVEYGSMTCPHCGHFALEDEPKLIDKYVRSGKVAFEFRNYVRDPYDLAATLTARCGGTSGFFPITKQMFATQEKWFATLRALGEPKLKALQDLSPSQQVTQIADLAGFTALARARGYPVAKYKACIGSAKNIDVVVRMHDAAGFVEGTPTFLLNGVKVEFDPYGAALWDQLDARISAAL